MYRRAVPVITSRIDMRSVGPEGLNRQSPSWVVGMATSVEPSGGLLKLDNQKLYVWLVVLSKYVECESINKNLIKLLN